MKNPHVALKIFFIPFLGFTGVTFSFLPTPDPVGAEERVEERGLQAQPFSDLNLRFSNRSLTPPNTYILQRLPLPEISVAKPFVAPVPQAVIFEDDRRQRVAVLSIDSAGTPILYLLEPLPLDPKLPTLVQCANQRGCDSDRTPLTGGLGCVALCIKELLEESALNQ
jgi:hypothetical protein